MKDWVEIGVFAPTKTGQELGRPLYRQKRLRNIRQVDFLLTIPEQPATVDVDPRHLLTTWQLNDNYQVVKSKISN